MGRLIEMCRAHFNGTNGRPVIFTFLMKDSGADGLHLCCSSYFIFIEIEIVLNQSFQIKPNQITPLILRIGKSTLIVEQKI